MKLFFDARYIRTDFHDGISRYSAELGCALAKLTKVTFIICDPAQLISLPRNAQYITIHAPTSVKEPFTASILNEYKPDVVFSPMQTIGTAGRTFKLILTLHDMIYYRHRLPPQDLNPLIRLAWRAYHLSYVPQRVTLNHADMIATVSNTSAREIERARLTKRPVIVTPNAPRDLLKFVESVDQKGAPKNIVYMGTFMPYKNVETLIKGMKWLPGRTLHLLSRIEPKRLAELELLIPKNADVKFYNGVSDQEYATLLSKKAVLASASFDEGYGIPVAEALAMGVPAVTSDISIFHEVAAGGALYFDPTKPKDFAEQVKRLDDKKLRDATIAHGSQHIASYSWQDSARTLLNAINSLV